MAIGNPTFVSSEESEDTIESLQELLTLYEAGKVSFDQCKERLDKFERKLTSRKSLWPKGMYQFLKHMSYKEKGIPLAEVNDTTFND